MIAATLIRNWCDNQDIHIKEDQAHDNFVFYVY